MVFRGEFRLKVSFARMSKVEASKGILEIAFPDGKLELDLGADAEKWALKIKNPKSLMDKLGVKAGQTVTELGVTDPTFRKDLSARIPDFPETPVKDADILFLQLDEPTELHKIEPLKRYWKPDGALWIVSPRGRKDFKDTEVMKGGLDAGLVDVKVSAFNATHTAQKFVFRLKDR